MVPISSSRAFSSAMAAAIWFLYTAILYAGGRLPSAVETAAYFVIAEALTNVAKYALVDRAEVSIRLEGTVAIVEVDDRGQGGASISAGSGLRSLRVSNA